MTKGQKVFFGKKYLMIEDLVKLYPECITINGLYNSEYNGETTQNFTFAEDDGYYFKTSLKCLETYFKNLVEHCGTNDTATIDAFLKENPVAVKIEWEAETKNHKGYWKVTPVEVEIKKEDLPF